MATAYAQVEIENSHSRLQHPKHTSLTSKLRELNGTAVLLEGEFATLWPAVVSVFRSDVLPTQRSASRQPRSTPSQANKTNPPPQTGATRYSGKPAWQSDVGKDFSRERISIVRKLPELIILVTMDGALVCAYSEGSLCCSW